MGFFSRFTNHDMKNEEDKSTDISLRHPFSSFKTHMKFLKEKMYKGDKSAWHQFLMLMMISFAGICIIMTLVINFCFELLNLREQLNYEHTVRIVNQAREAFYTQEKLFPGQYGIIRVFESASFQGDTKETSSNYVVMVADHKGGPVLLAVVPDGVKLPEKWDGNDSYILVVDNAGKWSFDKK